MSEEKTIKICTNHDEQVPLIWTFAFPGAEYWCPACGYECGMFGAGENVPETPQLLKAQEEWGKTADPYLSAISTFSCSELTYEGKRMKPSELPEEYKKKQKDIIANWKYKYE